MRINMTDEKRFCSKCNWNDCDYGCTCPPNEEVYQCEMYMYYHPDEVNEFNKADVLDKIRAEIAEYGSIMVAYAITKDTKTDKGIEKLVGDVLSEAKRQVLDIIDKYKAEMEEKG